MGEMRPKPQINFQRVLSDAGALTLQDNRSGELTLDILNEPIGTVKYKAGVSDVWISCAASGKDDSEDLYFEADVFINGTSCLTTKPKIAHVSGETSQQKTTAIAGDTGVTQAVIDPDNYSIEPGDVITFNFKLERTASPTTEILNPFIVVEVMPKL